MICCNQHLFPLVIFQWKCQAFAGFYTILLHLKWANKNIDYLKRGWIKKQKATVNQLFTAALYCLIIVSNRWLLHLFKIEHVRISGDYGFMVQIRYWYCVCKTSVRLSFLIVYVHFEVLFIVDEHAKIVNVFQQGIILTTLTAQ